MIGGPEEAVERCREPFGRWASLIVHVGPVGAGTRAKLARNLLQFAAYSAAAEAQRLAEAAGIDLRRSGQRRAAFGPRHRRSRRDHAPRDDRAARGATTPCSPSSPTPATSGRRTFGSRSSSAASSASTSPSRNWPSSASRPASGSSRGTHRDVREHDACAAGGARARVPAGRTPDRPRRHALRDRRVRPRGDARRRDRRVDGGEPRLHATDAARARLRGRRRGHDLQGDAVRHRSTAPVHGLPFHGARPGSRRVLARLVRRVDGRRAPRRRSSS